ncbi:protein S40-6-like [Henckelia pumila]|uniref:protein S40-6-like n=1 Tax=Henckelia pumila TaxID=405737 RepID=UPI003C6E9105
MADMYGGRKPLFEDEDLQEEEVWSLVKAREDSNSKTRKNHFPGSSSSNAWRNAAAPRDIRRVSAGGGGSSTAWTEPQQSSAPVDIPDWSKIMKRKSNKNLWDDASAAHGNDDDYMGWKNCHGLVGDAESYYDDDDDDDGNEMVPPHEYLARRLAGTQIASFSMCEGVGGTLKGRDLSKLRNAILTKTGFLE